MQLDLAPAWMVAVIIGREFAVTGLRSLAYARGVVIPASPLGKIKMVAQVVGDPAADSGARTSARQLFVLLGQVALWVVMVDRAGVGGRLLPAVQHVLNRASPISPRAGSAPDARPDRHGKLVIRARDQRQRRTEDAQSRRSAVAQATGRR